MLHKFNSHPNDCTDAALRTMDIYIYHFKRVDKAIRMSIIGTGNKNGCRREKMRLLARANQVVCVWRGTGEIEKKACPTKVHYQHCWQSLNTEHTSIHPAPM